MKLLDLKGASYLWGKMKDYVSGEVSKVDLSLFVIATELPTKGINPHKIYILANKDGVAGNRYTEYIYTGDTTKEYDAANWEKLGEYKADVDLTAALAPYAKTADVDTKVAAVNTAVQAKANKATTIEGYGITDAKIADGVITLGDQTLTPLTEATVTGFTAVDKKYPIQKDAKTGKFYVEVPWSNTGGVADSVAWGNVTGRPAVVSAVAESAADAEGHTKLSVTTNPVTGNPVTADVVTAITNAELDEICK